MKSTCAASCVAGVRRTSTIVFIAPSIYTSWWWESELMLQTQLCNMPGCATVASTTPVEKNRSAFPNGSTPANLYAQVCDEGLSASDKHSRFLNLIRRIVWSHTTLSLEEGNVPSLTALHLHWRRSQWVLRYWEAAKKQGHPTTTSTSTVGK